MNSKTNDQAQLDVVGQPTDKHNTAVSAWVGYCLRFDLQPDMLIGFRYPGLENTPMTAALAEEVRAAIGARSCVVRP